MQQRTVPIFLMALLFSFVLAPAAMAHCQIPCGIYGDGARFDEMKEHVRTIEKSMTQINEVGKEDAPNWNQLVRWVNNKEDHADELTEIVTSYFMAQRIKPPAAGDQAAGEKYALEISLLHRMIVTAMKAKQTTDLSHTEALTKLIDKFQHSYMGENHG